MHTLLHDLRYAVRSLLKAPGFTVTAVLTLALGIGATTTVFSVVEGVLLASLPFPHADRLVDIKQVRANSGGGGTAPFGSYQVWQTATRSFDGIAAYSGNSAVLTGRGPAERVMTWSATSSFFKLLGTRPYFGRLLTADDDRTGSEPVAVLSHTFWMSHFGGDPHAIGRSLTLDTVSYTIVGIAPPDFQYPATAVIWSNVGAYLAGPEGARRAHQWAFWVVARLRPSISLAQAQTDLDLVSRQAWDQAPDLNGALPALSPLKGYLVGQVRSGLLILLGAVALLLLIACANVASLLLSRGIARQHEMAIRVALGAGRARVALLVLAESAVVALTGGALGVLGALWSVPALVALAGSQLPDIAHIGVNLPVLAMACGATLAAGILAGVVPAIRATHRPPGAALKAQGAGTTATMRNRSASALIVAQVALALVLLVGAGLLTRSFLRLVDLDPGFAASHVVVATLDLPTTRYANADRRRVYAAEALTSIEALPGVLDAAIASGIPLDGGAISGVSIPGRSESQDLPWAWSAAVSPNYFHTLGIPVLRGNTAGGPHTVVIDEAAARAYFPGDDPIGKEISFYGTRSAIITGVVGDTRQESLAEAPPPHIYESLDNDPPEYVKALVRTSGDPAALVRPLHDALQAIDHDAPIDRAGPLSDRIGAALATERLYTLMLGLFAAAALALAATGLYGIAAHSVAQRTREIGIRRALGAERRNVLALIIGRGLSLVMVGLTLGLAGAVVGTRVLKSFLFQVQPLDPMVIGLVGVALAATALLASYLPARRATKVDPMVALRAE
ncbi:MAG TPA: ABC transporter permease [Gemmatimonadales bacterium]|nr:ABC transporter permease [Gemmatimonadales bacterium]